MSNSDRLTLRVVIMSKRQNTPYHTVVFGRSLGNHVA